MVAYKVGSKEEEEQKETERREKEKNEVQEAVGLSALLRKIADSVSTNSSFSQEKFPFVKLYITF